MHCGLWCAVQSMYNVDKNGENKCKKLYSTMHVHTYVTILKNAIGWEIGFIKA